MRHSLLMGTLRPNWVYTYTPTTGYCTETVMKWFGDGLKNPQKTIKIYLNGKELETDEAAESYYSFAVAAPTPSASTGTLIIKPGIEITNDFFATNQIEITDTESGDTVSVGTYVEPEATGPFAIDTALMSVTDEPSSYTGGKDAAFAVDQTGFIPILPQQAIALKL